MNIIERLTAPTPEFFKRIRNAGLFLTTLASLILSTQMPLSPALITAAGYIGLAGGVMSLVSQLTVENENGLLSSDSSATLLDGLRKEVP